jgi:tRNA G26 N,N-dimethylase Trm1
MLKELNENIVLTKQKAFILEQSLKDLTKELDFCIENVENITEKNKKITGFYKKLKDKKITETVSGTGIKAVRYLR